jgi:hypothetical protein
MKRFGLVLFICTLVRFYLGENTFSFLFFLILYFPMINWTVYWIFFSVRVAINKIYKREVITVPGIRRVYTWYLNIPGSLVLSEVIYLGAKYNHLI